MAASQRLRSKPRIARCNYPFRRNTIYSDSQPRGTRRNVQYRSNSQLGQMKNFDELAEAKEKLAYRVLRWRTFNTMIEQTDSRPEYYLACGTAKVNSANRLSTDVFLGLVIALRLVIGYSGL